MHITQSYIGTVKEPFKCLFFLLLEDYIEAQTNFARELDLLLERFARNLGNSAALVRPFTGDIDAIREQVLDKKWSYKELKEVQNTPALLMINQDFDSFSPREHPWLIVNLGRRVTDYYGGQSQFDHLLNELVEVVLNADEDFFVAANKLKHEIQATEGAKLFEAKPGIFGFSINLFYALGILKKIYAQMRGAQNIS
ncbi:hypothetical protein KJ693_11155 [bacterium]|nr:hypothetical protein [bacterium]MBU1615847.1 hypothetical protein [bacterium]